MTKYSMMIIDDDEVDRYLLKRIINKNDLSTKIFEVSNGVEALDFFNNYEENLQKYNDDFPPVIVFLDVNMPIMGGWKFLEEFSKVKAQNEIFTSSVFMMFTSSEREEEKKKAESYDFVKGFIMKGSLTPESLQEKVEKCMSQS